MKKIFVLAICCALISGCAYISYMKDPFADIPAFGSVSDAIYRGGQPKIAGYERLSMLGIRSIVSLSQDIKRVENEKLWAQANNVRFYHLPIDLYRMPSDDEALRFLGFVLDRLNYPVFIHCEDGRDRTGTMIAFYRIVVEGWTIKDAYHEARVIGYWPYHGDEAPLKAFIHQLKDKPFYFEKVKELKHAAP
jgi:protein tyrosine/serine phosphatase